MKERVPQTLEGVGVGLFWLALGFTLLAQTAPFYWVGEALSDLRWHMGFMAIVPALPAAMFLPRRRLTFMATIAIGVFNLLPGLRVYLPPDEPEFDVGVPLAVVDVRWGEAPIDALVDLANSNVADVLVVSGLTPEGRAALSEQLVAWPERQAWPPIFADREGAPLVPTEPSTLVFSRFEFDEFTGQGFGAGACLLEAKLDIGDLPLTVRIASFPEVGPGENSGASDALLEEIRRREWRQRGMLVCDLARSDSSELYDELLSITRYQDARRGFGRLPTMPAPFLGALRVPGQYVFFGRELAVSEHRTEEVAAGQRELVSLDIGADTPSFYPVHTQMRVRGALEFDVAEQADEEEVTGDIILYEAPSAIVEPEPPTEDEPVLAE